MELKLGANIQAMRRERGMTQEQLATAMGVTVGAVSKWEKGSCYPDVQLIPELAEFFGTSVDVLLGYGWEQGGMGRCAEHIRELLELKRYVLSLFAIVQQTVGVIGALAMMLWYSPLLTVAAVLLALLPAVASMACGGRLARAEEAVSRANAAFVDTVRDMRFGG